MDSLVNDSGDVPCRRFCVQSIVGLVGSEKVRAQSVSREIPFEEKVRGIRNTSHRRTAELSDDKNEEKGRN